MKAIFSRFCIALSAIFFSASFVYVAIQQYNLVTIEKKAEETKRDAETLAACAESEKTVIVGPIESATECQILFELNPGSQIAGQMASIEEFKSQRNTFLAIALLSPLVIMALWLAIGWTIWGNSVFKF